jgi:hypothetical protein
MELFEFGIHFHVFHSTTKAQAVLYPGITFCSLCRAPSIQTVFMIVKVMLEASKCSNVKFFGFAFRP